MAVPEMKRCQTEVNSNIVCLENINDIKLNESIFRKTTSHKGRLFRGPNWTAYNKENLGSIPRAIEKSIVEDKKSTTRIGFSTQTERFFQNEQSCKNNPGPGTYNVSTDMDFTRSSSSFYSSKGFGNGFTSNSERFDDTKLYYCKYTPGPGEYHPEDNQTLMHDIDNTLLGKSLFNTQKNRSLIKKRYVPGPGHYDPYGKTDYKTDKKRPFPLNDAIFRSTAKRFGQNKDSRFYYPGPGQYFNDDKIIDINDKSNQKKFKNSYYFKNPLPKKEILNDVLENYDIKTENKRIDEKYHKTEGAKENEDAQETNKKYKGKLRKSNFQDNNEYADFMRNVRNTAKENNPFTITKKDLFKLRNKTFLKDNLNGTSKGSNIILMNGGEGMDEGEEYIHKILLKPVKKAILDLNSPRWKKNKYEFKVPGPAYYHPKIQQKTLSFNKNNTDFIWTPGVVNEEIEEENYN